MSWAEFKDFDLDFTLPWANVITEGNDSYVTGAADGVPALATTKPASYMACISGMKYHGNQYGIYAGEIKVPVIPGKYEIGLGITDYGGKIYVYAGEKQIAVINSQSTNGDKFFIDKTKIATGQFVVESDCELSIATSKDKLGNVYYPYFSIKRIGDYELPSNVKVTYYDTDGKTIGTETVTEGSTLNFKYNESDVTVPVGCKFRGWFKSAGEYAEKVNSSFVVNSDLELYAKATLVEEPTMASSYNYDFTQRYWYSEDHESIELSGSSYWHDAQHGRAFKDGDAIDIKVAGNAAITIKRCCYGANTTFTLYDGSKVIDSTTSPVAKENDGESVTLHYTGGETTLTLKIESSGETYIHGIAVKHTIEFEPFKIDFRSRYYTVVLPEEGLPANVQFLGGSYHDDGSGKQNRYGYKKVKLKVLVDRPVKFYIGACDASDQATVSVDNDTKTVIETNTIGVDGLGVGSSYDNYVTYVYKGTEPAVISFDLGLYCPYFFAEEWNSPEYDEATKTFKVAAGNATQLRDAISEANTMGGNVTIFLPNGTYDLGSSINTEIKGNNIAIIGESRDGVIIKNSPAKEELDNTATLKNASTGLYLQNLTLECEAKYNEKAGTEVGVALWDRGTKTICKNVYLKGKQNTYYSNGAKGMIAYFEGGMIEGSVDIVCGSGNILFNSVQMIVNTNGGKTTTGGVIAAPSSYGGDDAEIGYVFANCLVTGATSQNGTYYLAHGWKAHDDASSAATFIGTNFAINPVTTYWGSTIGGDMKRRFAAYDASGVVLSKDPDNKVDVTKANLIAFAGSWDPAAIISQHCPIKTNGAGWASYTAFTDVYVQGEDVKTYVANKINKHSVLLETVDSRKLPAGTPVFVKGEPNTKYYVCGALVNKITKNNLLVTVLFDTTLNEYSKAFILGTKDGQPGLYKVDSNIVVPAGKCYLDARGTSLELLTKGELEMITDGSETTGIDNVVVGVDADAARYNLAGQKVDKSYKGIVVRKDGKKYFEK